MFITYTQLQSLCVGKLGSFVQVSFQLTDSTIRESIGLRAPSLTQPTLEAILYNHTWECPKFDHEFGCSIEAKMLRYRKLMMDT